MSDGHKVGYKRPPEKGRWKKGESGNPKGRKPKTTDPSKIFDLELKKEITLQTPNGEVKMPKLAAVIASTINDAIKGDNGARRLVFDIVKLKKIAPAFEPDENETALLEAYFKKKSGRTSK